jgi:ferritin-like metal-binding protein YciE
MKNKFDEVTPRNFNPMAAAGLSEEARKAVNAAFDAMSAWRVETAQSSEKNIEQVLEKMAAAARALGWPEEIVEATRAQMQSITKMQIQMMDHVMDAWEEQIKAELDNALGHDVEATLLAGLQRGQ